MTTKFKSFVRNTHTHTHITDQKKLKWNWITKIRSKINVEWLEKNLKKKIIKWLINNHCIQWYDLINHIIIVVVIDFDVYFLFLFFSFKFNLSFVMLSINLKIDLHSLIIRIVFALSLGSWILSTHHLIMFQCRLIKKNWLIID